MVIWVQQDQGWETLESSSQITLGPNTVVPPLNSPLELKIAKVVLFNKYTDLKLYTR